MKTKYTAKIFRDNDCWYGWIEDIPGVNCQEETLEELKESLFESLIIMENLNAEDTVKMLKWKQSDPSIIPNENPYIGILTA